MKLFAKIAAVVCISCNIAVSAGTEFNLYSTFSNDTLTITNNAINFFVIGDWGRNGDFNQKELAEQMNKTSGVVNPWFIFSTGDNFYENGIASVDDPQWWTSFENIYKGGYLLIEWYSVLGNHDYRGNTQAQIDYSKKSRRWRMPSRYYNFERKIPSSNKSILFLFLDTNQFEKSYYDRPERFPDLVNQDWQKQYSWADSVLSHTKADWKIVIGHHHVYTGGDRKNSVSETGQVLEPLLKKHSVDAYFCGHEHDLQHLKPEGKTHYFVSGAGSQLRETGTIPITKFAASVQGFCFVSAVENKLIVQMIDYLGNVIYKTEINK